MSTLEIHGIAAVALILLLFYSARRIPVFIGGSALVTVGFGLVACRETEIGVTPEYLVLLAGLPACAFGLLIVRVMLIRSVSLFMLADIRDGRPTSGRFGENVGGRLGDLQAFHLIRMDGPTAQLTAFGRVIGTIASVLYTLARIRA